MRNYIGNGRTVTLTAPAGGVVSGRGYIIGSLFVVAVHDAAAGASFEGDTVGVFDLAAATAEVIAEGAEIHFDAATGNATAVAGDDPKIGVAVAAKANGDTVVSVRLDGISL